MGAQDLDPPPACLPQFIQNDSCQLGLLPKPAQHCGVPRVVGPLPEKL